MIKRIFLFLCVIMTTTVYAGSADDVVNDVMMAYLKKHEVPGAAVMLYIDGKPHAYYYGYANRETKKPITKDTIFELGSITKVMTTLVLAQEVDFAKVKLKDPINKYIPTLPASFSDITLLNLATHTSGLPFNAPEDIKNRVEWEQYAQTWKPETKADEVYTYSNAGIGLIGQALETVTHESFNMLYRKKILAPLGMQQIGLTVPVKLKEFYAQGYTKQGELAPQVQDGLFPAAWAMKASAEDMSKFLSAAIGLPQTPESIFYPMRMTETTYLHVGTTEQALGWQAHDLKGDQIKLLLSGTENLGLQSHPVKGVFADNVFNGDQLIDKTGATGGFHNYIATIPSKKTGIVILTNRDISGNDTMLAGREILFKLNGLS
jgi:beta-lactamase class C